eukprot:5892445-Alexandrium_andersonii.AAC.1
MPLPIAEAIAKQRFSRRCIGAHKATTTRPSPSGSYQSATHRHSKRNGAGGHRAATAATTEHRGSTRAAR